MKWIKPEICAQDSACVRKFSLRSRVLVSKNCLDLWEEGANLLVFRENVQVISKTFDCEYRKRWCVDWWPEHFHHVLVVHFECRKHVCQRVKIRRRKICPLVSFFEGIRYVVYGVRILSLQSLFRNIGCYAFFWKCLIVFDGLFNRGNQRFTERLEVCIIGWLLCYNHAWI